MSNLMKLVSLCVTTCKKCFLIYNKFFDPQVQFQRRHLREPVQEVGPLPFSVYQNESMQLPECLHLSTDYHQVRKRVIRTKKFLFQGCTSFAGPVDGDIDACMDTDLNSCSAYIGEECQYVGERLSNIYILLYI